MKSFERLFITIFIFFFIQQNCSGQFKTTITTDTNKTYIYLYEDDFLDSHSIPIGKYNSKKYDFQITFPTLLRILNGGKQSLFMLLPKDSVAFAISLENKSRYKSISRRDSLFDTFNELEFTFGLELAYNSGYEISNVHKSDFKTLRESILQKMNKQLAVLNKFNMDKDSLRWKFMYQEINNFSLIELLEPYMAASNNKSYLKQIPLWYADSLRAFKKKLNDELYEVGGTYHKKAIVAYNQFLSIDSLGSKNDFQVLFNSAIRNFKGSHRDFLMAYLLKTYKAENLSDFYDKIGVFYQVCQDNYFIKYVKDKLDDNDFKYPEKILHTELTTSEEVKTTWEQILSKHKGKLVYIELWASWCPPCIFEIPCVKNLKKLYLGANIDFISISIDDKKKAWDKAIKKHYSNLPEEEHYWLSKSKKFTQFLLTRRENENVPIWIPKYILLDEKGNIITSNAVRPCFDKEVKRQIEIFLQK